MMFGLIVAGAASHLEHQGLQHWWDCRSRGPLLQQACIILKSIQCFKTKRVIVVPSLQKTTKKVHTVTPDGCLPQYKGIEAWLQMYGGNIHEKVISCFMYQALLFLVPKPLTGIMGKLMSPSIVRRRPAIWPSYWPPL